MRQKAHHKPHREFVCARRQIVLLSASLLSEEHGLLTAAPRAPAPKGHYPSYRGPPTLMCGRIPELFACTPDFQPLHFMEPGYEVRAPNSGPLPASQGRFPVCSDSRWRGMIQQCSLDEEWMVRHHPRGSRSCPLSVPKWYARNKSVPLLPHSPSRPLPLAGARGRIRNDGISGGDASSKGGRATVGAAFRSQRTVAAGGSDCRDCGVLMVALAADATAAKYVAEATDAARLLRHVARPALPITLFANPCFRSLLTPGDATLWDSHRPLRLADALRPFAPAGYEDDLVGDGCARSAGAYQNYRGAMLRGGALRGDHPLKIKAFVLKLSAMMSVEYGRALFLDLDVYVLSPGLPHELLSSALRAADVAMPGPVPERHALVDAALTEATRSAPVLCSCLVAFRVTPAVLAWMRDAARGILRAERPELKRQSDQEYLWLHRAENATHADLRVLALPDEYYCPAAEHVRVEPARGNQALLADVRLGGKVYACRSVHGHGVKREMVARVISG